MRLNYHIVILVLIFVSILIIAQRKDKFDLSIVSFNYEPKNIKVGDDVIFKYSIVNLGYATIPKKSFHIEFFIDGELFNFDYGTSKMEPGRKDINSEYIDVPLIGTIEYGTPHYKALKKGKHIYKLVLDTKNQIIEKNKSNNVRTGEFYIN